MPAVKKKWRDANSKNISVVELILFVDKTRQKYTSNFWRVSSIGGVIENYYQRNDIYLKSSTAFWTNVNKYLSTSISVIMLWNFILWQLKINRLMHPDGSLKVESRAQ